MIAGIEERVRARIAELAARIAEAVPEAEVEPREDGVVVRGRGVLSDPRLRWIGGLLR